MLLTCSSIPPPPHAAVVCLALTTQDNMPPRLEVRRLRNASVRDLPPADPRVRERPLILVDMLADPRERDDGTNLTGERGAQRYADQRAWRAQALEAQETAKRVATAQRVAEDLDRRGLVHAAAHIREEHGTAEEPGLPVAEREQANHLAQVQREQVGHDEQRRIEARDPQWLLDRQETERANSPYERELWAMPRAAWLERNNGIAAAERRVADQVARQAAQEHDEAANHAATRMASLRTAMESRWQGPPPWRPALPP